MAVLQDRTADRKIETDSVSAPRELRPEGEGVDSWQQQWRAAQPGTRGGARALHRRCGPSQKGTGEGEREQEWTLFDREGVGAEVQPSRNFPDGLGRWHPPRALLALSTVPYSC